MCAGGKDGTYLPLALLEANEVWWGKIEWCWCGDERLIRLVAALDRTRMICSINSVLSRHLNNKFNIGFKLQITKSLLPGPLVAEILVGSTQLNLG